MGEFESLDTDEPPAKRMERHAYDRLIMLSDGVFAIAVTLAALELRPPARWDGTAAAFWAEMTVPILTYIISFAVIGAFWLGHRRMLARVRRADMPFTLLNLVFLGWVALMPAVTALLSRTYTTFSGQIYAGAMIGTGLSQMAAWAYAAFVGKLVDDETPGALRWAVLIGMSTPTLIFLVVLCMGWPHQVTSLIGFVLAIAGIQVARRLALRRLERR